MEFHRIAFYELHFKKFHRVPISSYHNTSSFYEMQYGQIHFNANRKLDTVNRWEYES